MTSQPVLGYSQQGHSLAVTTPLGADMLLLTGFEGEELLSGLFHFHLTMASEHDDLDLDKVVGAGVTVTLYGPERQKRLFHGIAARAVAAGLIYHIELRPWLWWLTLDVDSRIFQNQTVPEIVQAVCRDHGFSDLRTALKGSYAKREYCVQYQETGFAFISRLLEEEGIFYFFEHAEGKHTLVLADDASAFQDCPNGARIPFLPLPPDKEWLDGRHVGTCALERQAVAGKYQTDDFNFETPSTGLTATVSGGGAMRVYDYPGGYRKKDEGQGLAKRRLQELACPARQITGAGTVRDFAPGIRFTLTGHPRADLNAAYALRTVRHEAARHFYRTTFTAFPADVPFRPPRITPRPRIVGTQTAIVTGKSGEEIWTDTYGRIKVHFHWDQTGPRDESSSCWVRVAQNWTGKGWGAVFLPRLGQEVVVSFLDGDPDRPLVTGCVYNGENTVPYALPDQQTVSAVKTNTSKGGGGFNEIRLDDAKDKELLALRAQKDMTVKVLHDRTEEIDHDETVTVKHDRSATITEGNESLTVSKGDRTVTVAKGKETHTVKDTRAVTVEGAETHDSKAGFTHKVSGGNYTLKVSGDIVIDATGSVTIKAGQGVTIQSGTGMTIKSGTDLTASAGLNLTVKAGLGLTLQGGTTLDAKASAMGTVDGGGMLNLKGGLVKLN